MKLGVVRSGKTRLEVSPAKGRKRTLLARAVSVPSSPSYIGYEEEIELATAEAKC